MLVDIPADELLARLKAGKVYMPEQAERAARQLLPQGQPDGAARARAAPHRRPRRGRRPGLSHRQGDRARLEDRGLAAVLHRAAAPAASTSCAARRGSRRSSASNGPPSTSRRRRCSGCPRRERERILRTVKLAQELGAKTAILVRQRRRRGRSSSTRARTTARRWSSGAYARRVAAGRGRAASPQRIGRRSHPTST